MITKFRKKPVVVKAVQWTGDNLDEVKAFLGDDFNGLVGDGVSVRTLEGPLTASLYDWLIEGVKQEHYPCKPDILEATYEPADDSLRAPDGAPWHAHLDGPCGPGCDRLSADG